MKKNLLLLLLFLTLLGNGLLVLKGKPSRENNKSEPTTVAKFSFPEEEEKEIEVSLTPRNDKKAVILKISKISKEILSIDYELSYETKDGLPRGVLGKIDPKGQESVLREILLGTCSRNVCVYDQGVEKVSLTLRFNKKDGGKTGFRKDFEF